MNEYRMTRPDVYASTGCPGNKNKNSRQGYYITAVSETDAHMEMRKMFPRDSGFDLQLWKEDVQNFKHCATIVKSVQP